MRCVWSASGPGFEQMRWLGSSLLTLTNFSAQFVLLHSSYSQMKTFLNPRSLHPALCARSIHIPTFRLQPSLSAVHSYAVKQLLPLLTTYVLLAHYVACAYWAMVMSQVACDRVACDRIRIGSIV